MYRPLSQTGPLFLVVLLSLGCSASPSRLPQPAPSLDCEEGTAVLVVSNGSGGDVEIVESVTGSAGWTVIAVVPSGRHELEIPAQTKSRYSYRRVGTRTVLTGYRQRRDVSLERECS